MGRAREVHAVWKGYSTLARWQDLQWELAMLACESNVNRLNARDNHVYHGEGALYADYEDMTNDVKPIYKGEWLSQGVK